MRNTSYLFSLGTAVIIAAGSLWAIETDARPIRADLQRVDGLRFDTLVPSDHDALRQCVVCHRVTPDAPERSAPALWAIVDAPKSGASWYGYSVALAEAGGDWSAEDLDRYLENPVAFLPGTTKTLSPIRDAEQRHEIITALQHLAD